MSFAAQDRARPQSAEAGANMEGEEHKIGAALNARFQQT